MTWNIGDYVIVMPDDHGHEGQTGVITWIEGDEHTVRLGVAEYGHEIILQAHELWPDPKHLFQVQDAGVLGV